MKQLPKEQRPEWCPSVSRSCVLYCALAARLEERIYIQESPLSASNGLMFSKKIFVVLKEASYWCVRFEIIYFSVV